MFCSRIFFSTVLSDSLLWIIHAKCAILVWVDSWLMFRILFQGARSRRWGPRQTLTSRPRWGARSPCSWWPVARRTSPRPRERSSRLPSTSARSEPPGRTISAPVLSHPPDLPPTSPDTWRSRCVCPTGWLDSWSDRRAPLSSASSIRPTLTSWLRRGTRSPCSTLQDFRRVWRLPSERSRLTSPSGPEAALTLCSQTTFWLQTQALCSTPFTSPASAASSLTWTPSPRTTCSRPRWPGLRAAARPPPVPQLPAPPVSATSAPSGAPRWTETKA